MQNLYNIFHYNTFKHTNKLQKRRPHKWNRPRLSIIKILFTQLVTQHDVKQCVDV